MAVGAASVSSTKIVDASAVANAAILSMTANVKARLIVLPGTESRSKSSVMLPDGRTDIPLMMIEVFLCTQEHDPHAIIECKRIAGSDAHLCREYVVEGVDRFASGKYGENHAVGFMVGYVLSGAPASAATGINAYLTRVSRMVDQLAPSHIIDALTWYSRHARAEASCPIGLHHAFLGVPGGTNASET